MRSLGLEVARALVLFSLRRSPSPPAASCSRSRSFAFPFASTVASTTSWRHNKSLRLRLDCTRTCTSSSHYPLHWIRERERLTHTRNKPFVRRSSSSSSNLTTTTRSMSSSNEYGTLNLKGKVVLVTGASAGIGEACAHRFASEGCKLILIARRLAKLEETKKLLEEKYPECKVHCVQFDVKNLDKIGELKSGLPAEFSAIDILVNNAGVALGTPPAHENPIEDVETMLRTNVSSVMAFVSTFAPGMVERDQGHIVNISSIAGHESYPGGSVYCATKHAIDAFTVAMRHDLVGTNIRVTAISPGAVRTEFTLVRFGQDASKEDNFYKGFTPLNAWDIADNVLYTCTRPSHVQIGDMIIYATKQSSAKSIAKNE